MSPSVAVAHENGAPPRRSQPGEAVRTGPARRLEYSAPATGVPSRSHGPNQALGSLTEAQIARICTRRHATSTYLWATPNGGSSRVPLSLDGYAPRLPRAAVGSVRPAAIACDSTPSDGVHPAILDPLPGREQAGGGRGPSPVQPAGGGRSNAPHHAQPGAWKQRGRQPSA